MQATGIGDQISISAAISRGSENVVWAAARQGSCFFLTGRELGSAEQVHWPARPKDCSLSPFRSWQSRHKCHAGHQAVAAVAPSSSPHSARSGWKFRWKFAILPSLLVQFFYMHVF